MATRDLVGAACGSPVPGRRAAWTGISLAFAALGRVFVSLDRNFRVLHASSVLDTLVGEGAVEAAIGRPMEELLGADLFGEAGALRLALQNGQRREGWRAMLQSDTHGAQLVSVTAAPLIHGDSDVCDPNAEYVVVMRPASEEINQAETTAFMGIVARSPAMIRVIDLIHVLRDSLVTCLLTGASGTGKEVVARALHMTSKHASGPFVAVNCGALPADLLESELFGHVKGAFTGAIRDRLGRFEEATNGTLFLDEVGDLPMPLQVKLLRVLQEQTFQRVGGNGTVTTNARIIAATNRDLTKQVADGEFREDLYYRLRVVPIHIEKLAHRREDIELLARYFLAKVGVRQGRTLRFSPDAFKALLQYPWPGNVRELQNCVEYAVAVCQRQTILPEDLPSELTRQTVEPTTAHLRGEEPRQSFVDGAPPTEAAQIRTALEEQHWNRGQAAKALGMSRTTLWRKMREYQLG
ncbi:MAG: sigma-54-dependent Fis family transcriptional regulator [Deltaproteobacteria bacterium CG2_30_63_29]|nr:MAG: sigma-54-dependent Fis family transcriptional regulator [Deltaproteobacteria bacterium CG2_30_63_29]PJB46123.1 MAG: sigma-54-dependent Fis family transcriptional regulator [Deltaproteobacteria bacterium CG_4_9_14_3_um_filter_63_12]